MSLKPVHHAADADLKMDDVEVDQEAQFLPAEFEIREELGFVNWKQRFDSFQFENDGVFDE